MSSIYLYRFFYFACILLLPAFLSCGDKIEMVAPPKSGEANEIARNVEMLYSDSALLKAKLKSPLVHRFSDSTVRVVFPVGIHLDFYDENGNISSWMTSEYAIRYENEKKMEAKKNVVVVNNKGEKLNTEHLIWDQAKKTIYTSAAVTITKGNEIIRGEGMEAKEDFTNWKIKRPKGSTSIKEND